MSSKIMTADGYVTPAADTATKKITGIYISAEGAAEGDKIAIREGGPTGEIKFFSVIPTDNGDSGPGALPPQGIMVGGPIYYSEVAAISGKIRTLIIWE